jgi:hypothetical protein
MIATKFFYHASKNIVTNDAERFLAVLNRLNNFGKYIIYFKVLIIGQLN